jgi:adenylate cyclase
MGLEIERKFLIKDDSWKDDANKGISIKQGYLNSKAERTVRIRIYGDNGVLTVKAGRKNLSRKEFEYQIPMKDAFDMLNMCEKPIIEKTRFLISKNNSTWEIDVFEGINEGLIVAEIELTSEEESFDSPSWLGEEVSLDSKYYNSSLMTNPYSKWKK